MIDMTGKVCLVTGATSGIGLVAARELARMGASVVLHGRSREKCEAAAEAIRRETANPSVEYLVADLADQGQVRRLADEFKVRHDRLHVLVNNAGAMFSKRRTVPHPGAISSGRPEGDDGVEMTFAVNHLAYFLLTNLLLDALKAGAPSRVVNVASDAHRMLRLDFDDLQSRRKYRTFRVYGRSKLANILFNAELARRLEGSGVTANALHPGFVATNFMAGNGRFGWIMRRLASLLAISPDDGARTTIYLAGSPEVEGISGRYFDKQKPANPSPAARDTEAARRLWRISEELTGMVAEAEA